MKLDDVPFIVRDMKNEMPKHTENDFAIPSSFSQGLPKNVMDFSAKVDNKFLNNHLHEILEFYHCFPQYHSKGFEKYQIQTYAKNYDILNHDGCFKDEKIKDWYERIQKGEAVVKGSSLMIPSSYVTHPAAGGGCTGGSTIETTTSTSTTALSKNQTCGTKTTGNTTGVCYDQISVSTTTATGDYNLGFWETSSRDLIESTGSISAFSDYSWQSLTEYTLADGEIWLGYIWSDSNTIHRGTVSNNSIFNNGTFPTLVDPLGGSNSSIQRRLKLGHS